MGQFVTCLNNHHLCYKLHRMKKRDGTPFILLHIKINFPQVFKQFSYCSIWMQCPFFLSTSETRNVIMAFFLLNIMLLHTHLSNSCGSEMLRRINLQVDLFSLSILPNSKLACTLNCPLCYTLFLKTNYNSASHLI